MIPRTHQAGALGALNATLVVLRKLATEGRAASELAELLDLVEYLPRLLAEAEDRRTEFRDVLADLVAREADFGLALHRFDHPADPW